MSNNSSFNTDFWIAVSTAAPVIALSCIVLLTDQLDLLSDRAKLRKIRLRKTKVHILRLAGLSYWLNSTNLVFQALIFVAALNELAVKKSWVPLGLTVDLEMGGICMLLAASGFAAVSKIQVRKYELIQKRPGTTKGRQE